ncbi:MAG: hypothetical protein MJ159_03070 [Treponemataceae bacterium]|nr:hypothetical protein [Treponemataceae bacterium]
MNDFLEIAEDKGIEALDFIIDKITNSKYFEGFPVISQMLGVIKAVKVIPNYLYAKKTYAFLDGLKSDNMDCDTFSKAMDELNKNPRKFEEELLFLIEKAENTEKANLLGYFTRLFALRCISYEDYIFYTNVINNIQMNFLKSLSANYKNMDFINNSPLYGILQSQGFSENGSGFKLQDGSLHLKLVFSDKINFFCKYLENFFKDYSLKDNEENI